MSTLLRIDSSSRTEGSHSRALGDALQVQWLAHHEGGTVVARDLVKTPVPHIANLTIAGFFTPVEHQTPEIKAAIAFSDELVAEILAADEILVTLPMYNFGIPSALKAYIDHVSRNGKTFSVGPAGYKGLLNGKKTYIASSYGGAGYIGGQMAEYNFVEPYLRTVLGFLGLTDITFFSVEGSNGDPEKFALAKENAHAAISTAFGA